MTTHRTETYKMPTLREKIERYVKDFVRTDPASTDLHVDEKLRKNPVSVTQLDEFEDVYDTASDMLLPNDTNKDIELKNELHENVIKLVDKISNRARLHGGDGKYARNSLCVGTLTDGIGKIVEEHKLSLKALTRPASQQILR